MSSNSYQETVTMSNNTTTPAFQPSNFESEAKYNKFALHEVYLSVLVTVAVLSPVAVVANGLVLAAIWRNLSLRTSSYILLAGLAFTDFCTGLISQPLWIANELFSLKDPQLDLGVSNKTSWPTIYVITRAIGDRCVVYFYQITVFLITLMSIERWLLMSRRSLLSVSRVSLIVLALLLLMLPSAIFLHGQESDLTVISLVLFCVVANSVAYFKVFRIIRRHQHQIQANVSSQNASQPAINFVKYKKSVFTILFILAVFYISYLPIIITLGLKRFLLINPFLVDVFFKVSTLLVFLSSSLNPLIVLWRMKDIRDEVIKMLKWISCKNNQAQ